MTTRRQVPAPERGDEPDVAIADNPAESRFEISVDGELAGLAAYRDGQAGRAFTHTEVAAEYEGMGLASQLIRYALDEARNAGRKVLPFCPFVRSFIERHRDYLDLVAQPERFDLAR
jgi:predicted GNAT family acetyltransferase